MNVAILVMRKWKKYHVGDIELWPMPAAEPPIEQTGETRQIN